MHINETIHISFLHVRVTIEFPLLQQLLNSLNTLGKPSLNIQTDGCKIIHTLLGHSSLKMFMIFNNSIAERLVVA